MRAATPEVERDPDVLGAYVEDASGRPPGHAVGLLRPTTPGEVSDWLDGRDDGNCWQPLRDASAEFADFRLLGGLTDLPAAHGN